MSGKRSPDVAAGAIETTIDAFLGGKVEAVQPARGHHRSGLEAVLLAGSLDAAASGTVVDLGAGAGVAGLCVAARCPGVTVMLVERDPVLIACTREALQRKANAAFARRVVSMQADIANPAIPWAPSGDEVVVNPPFHEEGAKRASPARARAEAHMLGKEGLELWVNVAAKLLKPAGRLTMIFRADALSKLLAAVGRQFGGLDVLPIHPRAALPAHRLIISGRKGSRAPLQLLPPLILHGEHGNAFRSEIDAVLRDGAGLDDVHPSWRNRR